LNRPNPDGHGYAVFGKVVSGMDVVDKIAKIETRRDPRGERSEPVKAVVIESVRRVDSKK
jgi:peptidyl-prolyl cis-trans isomerase A (cyclophilin A)